MRPLLVVNPPADAEFGAEARRHVDEGAQSAEELESLLRERYPRAVARDRVLSAEQGRTWYVYREGHWVPSEAPGTVSAPSTRARNVDSATHVLDAQGALVDSERMEDMRTSTAELLAAWREATRAAEEAAGLARQAEALADQADMDADRAAEIADLAQKAVDAARRAADRAQAAADRATALAASLRNPGVGDARHHEDDATAVEVEARDRYHVAEADARGRRSVEGTAEKR